MKIYKVGGAVRDELLGLEPTDNDWVVVGSTPKQMLSMGYKQVGKEYRWIDRLVWDDNKWISYVENPKVKTYILKDSENLVGYFEIILDFQKKQSEIAYFGILSEYFGKKYGGYLLSEAIIKSFENSTKVSLKEMIYFDTKNKKELNN